MYKYWTIFAFLYTISYSPALNLINLENTLPSLDVQINIDNVDGLSLFY